MVYTATPLTPDPTSAPVPLDRWTHFLISLCASLPALLAAIAAFVQALNNGGTSTQNAAAIAITRKHVEALRQEVTGEPLPAGPVVQPRKIEDVEGGE